jgi:hypothetical protein
MLLLLFACTEPLDDRTPIVDEPRVLAVAVTPPEAAEGDTVAFEALYADATGALAKAPIDWSFCTATKPLAELGPIAETCVDPASEDLAAIGTGIETSGTLPTNACSLFGPNPPPPEEGQPAGRPQDPDVTGGFYQPAVGFEDELLSTLVPVRVRCGIANVTQETYVAWNQRYHSNQNPDPAAITYEPVTVAAGETVTLTASWPECPDVSVCGDGVCSADEDLVACPDDCSEPHGCGGAETYVLYEDGELTTRREAISATWFATAGGFDAARVGRDGDDPATSVDNGWTAPTESGDVWIAVVLRDERGGVSVQDVVISVNP